MQAFSGPNMGVIFIESESELYDEFARLKGTHYPERYQEAKSIYENQGEAELKRQIKNLRHP